MAQKHHSGSDPELIFAKIYLILEGLLSGAVLGALVVWLFYPAGASYEFCKKASFFTGFVGAVIGGIIGWLWANKEVWQD